MKYEVCVCVCACDRWCLCGMCDVCVSCGVCVMCYHIANSFCRRKVCNFSFLCPSINISIIHENVSPINQSDVQIRDCPCGPFPSPTWQYISPNISSPNHTVHMVYIALTARKLDHTELQMSLFAHVRLTCRVMVTTCSVISVSLSCGHGSIRLSGILFTGHSHKQALVVAAMRIFSNSLF